jgi:hypothetical protein
MGILEITITAISCVICDQTVSHLANTAEATARAVADGWTVTTGIVACDLCTRHVPDVVHALLREAKAAVV